MVQGVVDSAKFAMQLGSYLPVIGSVCTSLQVTLQSLADVLDKSLDMVAATRLTLRILDFMSSLHPFLSSMGHDDREKVGSAVGPLCTALKELNEIILTYHDKGFIKRVMWSVSASNGRTLARVTADVNATFDVLQQRFNFARDSTTLRLLAEIKSMTFPMEDAIMNRLNVRHEMNPEESTEDTRNALAADSSLLQVLPSYHLLIDNPLAIGD